VVTGELNDLDQEFSMTMSLDKTKLIYSRRFFTPMSAFAPFVDDAQVA
jgi:hypothetical protein